MRATAIMLAILPFGPAQAEFGRQCIMDIVDVNSNDIRQITIGCFRTGRGDRRLGDIQARRLHLRLRATYKSVRQIKAAYVSRRSKPLPRRPAVRLSATWRDSGCRAV